MNCKFGRGMFTTEDISENKCILKNNFMIIPEKENNGKIARYVFYHSKTKVKLVLGDISLINHDENPNAKVQFTNSKANLVAVRDIRKGDQIFIDYGYSFDSNGNAYY
jgi:SET domain-containing protein